jgi:hypothetical protein
MGIIVSLFVLVPGVKGPVANIVFRVAQDLLCMLRVRVLGPFVTRDYGGVV